MAILKNTIHFPDSDILLFKTFSLILPLLDSSIVNEAMKTISSQFIFFMKRFWARKNANQAKTNQQNKNKQTKNNKGNNFLHIKTSKRKKVVCFALWCFLCAQSLFVKKINWLEIVLIASFTILLSQKFTSYFCWLWTR